MGKALRALIVEDVERDALLLVRELQRGGFDVTFERVDTAEALASALDQKSWDIIVSDYTMPRFSAPQALALVKARRLELPFIIVSGTVDEEMAVGAIRAGAHDFMAKGRLARLVPAIERELQEATLRAERSRLEQQLVISDRMASVGTLAAGVAHEINNPLCALMGNLEFVADDLGQVIQDISALALEDDAAGRVPSASLSEPVSRLTEIQGPLNEARDAAERVRMIVRDLKAFSRADEETRGPVDVHRVIDSSIRMAHNEIRHRARLVKVYGDIPLVEGNEARLSQVFLNLLVNAAYAVPEAKLEQNEIRVETRLLGEDRVVVEVRDTGAGIPAEALPRIFDPFFTTKPIGVGTGLGLAICHRIVTALGGAMEAESQPGAGTAIRAILRTTTGTARESQAQPGVAAQRRGKILLVDDEAALGTTLQRMLSSAHDVVCLTTARDALDRIRQGERFDVVLCDLMMPDVTGMDLYVAVSNEAPDQVQKMAFMTGGAFTSRAHDFLDRVRAPCIEKPFSSQDLLRFINSLLH
jgi:signal transduction histidine kinase